MANENMTIRTACGVIDITLQASTEENLKVLREELFNWYEDLVGRELEQGRHVQTTNVPYTHFKSRDEAFDRVEKAIKGLNVYREDNLCHACVHKCCPCNEDNDAIIEAIKLLRWLQETYLLPF